MRDYFEEMLQPTDKLTLTVRILTAVWLAVLLLEFAVWLVICIVSGDLGFPWWLWTVLAGGVLVGGFRLYARKARP